MNFRPGIVNSFQFECLFAFTSYPLAVKKLPDGIGRPLPVFPQSVFTLLPAGFFI